MAKELSDPERDAVNAESFAGRKIEAIKVYREATDEGLKEAKDAVEAMEAELRGSDPSRFRIDPSKGGYTWTVLLCLAAFAIWKAI
jgi:hypothetical protein